MTTVPSGTAGGEMIKISVPSTGRCGIILQYVRTAARSRCCTIYSYLYTLENVVVTRLWPLYYNEDIINAIL